MKDTHPYRNPDSPGNKLRPSVRCIGCGCLGCITAWGDWCFKCNVERLDRIDAQFDKLRHQLAQDVYSATGLDDPTNRKSLRTGPRA